MAQTRVLMWLFYDTTLLAWAIGRIPTFIELSTIQGAISTILFTAFVIFRLISLWEDIRKKRLDNKERAHIVEKKISGGIGVVVRREDAELVPSIEFFHDIKNSVDRVFDSTKADRFLILKAENGKTDFKFESVLYEQHKKTEKTKWSIGAAGRYLHFEFGQDYNQRLKEAERSGVVDLIVENLPCTITPPNAVTLGKSNRRFLVQLFLFQKAKGFFGTIVIILFSESSEQLHQRPMARINIRAFSIYVLECLDRILKIASI